MRGTRLEPGPPDPEFEVLAARPHTPPLTKRNESAHVPCQLFITQQMPPKIDHSFIAKRIIFLPV